MLLNLKIKMLERGIKQCDIAEHLGIGESLMSRYISERRPVPDEHKKMIAELLDADISDLFPEECAVS